MTQVKTRPPSFVAFCSTPEDLPTSYTRFLVNGLRRDFDMPGVPIRLALRKQDNPYADRKPRRATSHRTRPRPERCATPAAAPRGAGAQATRGAGRRTTPQPRPHRGELPEGSPPASHVLRSKQWQTARPAA